MPWKIRATREFSKYLKRLGSEEITKFDNATKDMGDSKDPTKFGELKQTKRHGVCFVMELTRSIRLAYRVYRNEEIVELACVGDHKLIYGRG